MPQKQLSAYHRKTYLPYSMKVAVRMVIYYAYLLQIDIIYIDSHCL